MYDEDELLPLSALQHLMFCERQCALIHVERAWIENQLTVEGTHFHEKVDGGSSESRPDLKILRSVHLHSRELGLIGKADTVELHRDEGEGDGAGFRLVGSEVGWIPFPVEHKRGRPKSDQSDSVQLCAQAMCLEEVLGVPVRRGALFYARTKRRQEIEFDRPLRTLVISAAKRLHEIVDQGLTPGASREPKCESCSLLPVCLPRDEKAPRSVSSYIDKMLIE